MEYSGLGILVVALAVVMWLLFLAIKNGLKKAAWLPVRQREWHESVLATSDVREETMPTAVVAIVQPPRYEREICEILARMEAEEADVRDDQA